MIIIVDTHRTSVHIGTDDGLDHILQLPIGTTYADVEEAVFAAIASIQPKGLTITPDVAHQLRERVKANTGSNAPVFLATGPSGIQMEQQATENGYRWLIQSRDWGITWHCTYEGSSVVWTTVGSLEQAMMGPA